MTSGTYFVFLIAVFFLYWMVAGNRDRRVALLVAANGCFYALAGMAPVLLLLAVTAVDYTVARLVAGRRWLLGMTLTVDVGALCLFKYANLFPGMLVPIGISFFIFQSIAYVVDVSRREIAPAESYLDYLAFISFFPTITAGPILRARQLLPRLREGLALDAETGGRALFLIALGLIKKIALADYLSVNLVDRVFDFPERFSALEVLVAVYAYALQIYADFSGYTEIALGSALLLGFKLPENFNAPYRARDLPEFWRRWHISLSTWLRDYVFFTLVGERARRRAALYGGLIATMLVGGLWHGPGWNFVLWGLLHGIGLAAVRLWQEWRQTRARGRRSSLLGLLLTFHFVCVTWIFFRAENPGQALGVLRQLATLSADTSNLAWPVVLLVAVGYAAHWLPDRLSDAACRGFARLPAPVQAAALFGLGLGLYSVASSDVVPFIYARF